MKKLISLILAALLALSTLSVALADTYEGNKDVIKGVQSALNKAGYDCGKPDGSAGKKTNAAISQFQTDHGMEANGAIDDALLKALWDNSVDDILKEAFDKTSADGNFDYSNPIHFVALYNELMSGIYRFLWGEDDNLEKNLRIANDADNMSVQELTEADGAYEGAYYVNFSGGNNALGGVCAKNGNALAFDGLQTNFVLYVGSDNSMLSFSLPTTAAFAWTYAAYFHKGDVGLTNADLSAALEKYGFTGYWGGLSIDGWETPLELDGYTIRMEYDSARQQIILRAENSEANDGEKTAGEAEATEEAEAAEEAEATEEAEVAEKAEAAEEAEATEEAEVAGGAEPAEEPEAAEEAAPVEEAENTSEPGRVYTDKDTVKKVQQALNDAGYNCGKPDGIAGKKTFAAITQYRTDKGLEVSEAIDDALLEAMGIAAPQAQAEAQPQADAAAAAPDAGEDMNDYNVVSACYNNALAARLAELGVEGDIGQEAYKVTSAQRASREKWGWQIDAEKSNLAFGTSYVPEIDCEMEVVGEGERKEDAESQPLNYLEHAVAYAMLETINRYFNGSEEDLAGALAMLGDAPSGEGTAYVTYKWMKNWYSCEKYAITVDSYGNLLRFCAVEPGLDYDNVLENVLEGDEVPPLPEEVAKACGGIPEVLDEQWKFYDSIEECKEEDGTWNDGMDKRGIGVVDNYGVQLNIGVETVKDDDGESAFGRAVFVINVIDTEKKLHRWYTAYDESGNMIEKHYEY